MFVLSPTGGRRSVVFLFAPGRHASRFAGNQAWAMEGVVMGVGIAAQAR